MERLRPFSLTLEIVSSCSIHREQRDRILGKEVKLDVLVSNFVDLAITFNVLKRLLVLTSLILNLNLPVILIATRYRRIDRNCSFDLPKPVCWSKDRR